MRAFVRNDFLIFESLDSGATWFNNGKVLRWKWVVAWEGQENEEGHGQKSISGMDNEKKSATMHALAKVSTGCIRYTKP
jgi:hypothetical protein